MVTHEAYEQQSVTDTLKEICSFLSLTIAAALGKKKKSLLSCLSFSWLENSHCDLCLFRLTSLISLGFQEHSSYKVTCHSYQIPGLSRCPNDCLKSQVAYRAGSRQVCVFTSSNPDYQLQVEGGQCLQ